ncbi:unnamed protein product [Gongylonema pulchrum]|uniref:BACK domain-containing protein n=1 Tax=Gongylonema pulchrum TaxID=637853 RepID=A0A183E4E5_9BILA|nr:unnamed protein product [Gongylonema pulchrum]
MLFQLREIASDKLEKNELVQLLSWVNAYGYISLTKEVSHDIIPNVVEVSVDEFLNFANKYKGIALANNLDICAESTEKLKQHIRLTMETDVLPVNAGAANSSVEGVSGGTVSLSSRSMSIMGVSRHIGALLDEVSEDIAPHLAEIMTKRWYVL